MGAHLPGAACFAAAALMAASTGARVLPAAGMAAVAAFWSAVPP